MNAPALVASAIVLAFAFPAASPAVQAKPGFVPVDACLLLTKAEVESLVGGPGRAGPRRLGLGPRNGSDCSSPTPRPSRAMEMWPGGARPGTRRLGPTRIFAWAASASCEGSLIIKPRKPQ